MMLNDTYRTCKRMKRFTRVKQIPPEIRTDKLTEQHQRGHCISLHQIFWKCASMRLKDKSALCAFRTRVKNHCRCHECYKNKNKFQAVSIHCRIKASAQPSVGNKQSGLSTLLKSTKSMKAVMTSARIEPTTVGLVIQHLNHWATDRQRHGKVSIQLPS